MEAQFWSGNVSHEGYRDILKNNVNPSGIIGKGFVLQQDNDPKQHVVTGRIRP